eukprot:NODE_197_length_15379_cov_0.485602.p1 type:complete len:484 gc:universal NODE_197_length_15379_cov_0.485602:5069-3618(-)
MFFSRAQFTRRVFQRYQSSLPKSRDKNIWYLAGVALIAVPSFVYFTSPKEPLPRAKDLIKSKAKLDRIIEEVEKPGEVVEREEAPISDTDAEQQVFADPIEDKPLKVKYVLVGSGVASFSAIKGIRKNDQEGQIIIISEEAELPYQKPPMSKELWISGNDKLEFKDWSNKTASVYYKPLEFYEKQNVEMKLNRKVVAIDAENQIITLDNGESVHFERLLIATGSKPIELPSQSANISTFRHLNDFIKLRELAKKKKEIAVIGGGFLGSELAVGLAQNGARVQQVYPESGNLGLVLPKYLSDHCKEQVELLNIRIHANSLVKEMRDDKDKVLITLDNNQILKADHCVVCIGAKPNVEVAKLSGFEIDSNGGILVNSELSARSNIYAAGDCISFYDPLLGRRRVEHYDHAVQSGYHAGMNMAGYHKPYLYQSMFWSDVGPNVSFEAVGIVNSKMSTKSFWNINENKLFDKGVLFYHKDDKIGIYF